MPVGEVLEWDSDFWAATIARVQQPGIDDWAHEHDVACAYLLVAAGDSQQARRAENEGFRLTDVRVELETATARSEQPVRPHIDEDVERLRKIARTNHRDTRFYADPNFPREGCDRLYDTWIRRSCEGWADVVLVVEAEGAAAGYVSVHRRGDAGSIGLIGVDTAARGHGAGEALVRGALDWCARQSLARCTVVTQGRNVAAQRLFQRCGFRTTSVDLWFHKWWDR
jgi:dTDP-4-amino-4,6-dideoxy-D-galactose acyltransferase